MPMLARHYDVIKIEKLQIFVQNPNVKLMD